MAADSTILRMVNLFIALSLGVHLEQLEHRIGLTCPLPFLLRPLRRHVSVCLFFRTGWKRWGEESCTSRRVFLPC